MTNTIVRFTSLEYQTSTKLYNKLGTFLYGIRRQKDRNIMVDLSEIDLKAFSKTYGVGKVVIQELIELIRRHRR